MSEYTKKTVADLQEILKSRGLAATGKKAELIARLTAADKEAETATGKHERLDCAVAHPLILWRIDQRFRADHHFRSCATRWRS